MKIVFGLGRKKKHPKLLHHFWSLTPLLTLSFASIFYLSFLDNLYGQLVFENGSPKELILITNLSKLRIDQRTYLIPDIENSSKYLTPFISSLSYKILGYVRTFCPVLPVPFHFVVLAPFYQFLLPLFHLSLLPAPFTFLLLLPDHFSCSLLYFPIFCCTLLPFPHFCAPCSQITFSLLHAPFITLGYAPCSLKGHSPCSLITPNGGSSIQAI